MSRLIIPESFKVFCLRQMQHVPRRWWLAAYWLALACTVRAHHYAGHPLVPVPFPYTAGSYRHTSSVVNVPIHQERVIIIKKPGNHHHQHNGYAHEYRHTHTQGRSPQREHMHEHDSIQPDDRGHGYREQESQIPFMGDIRPLNYYQAPRSQNYPYFQDVGYLLDPRFIQQSLWLEQFPDML